MALIFNDTFTAAANQSLASHTPDTGTSWTQIINTASDLAIDATSDRLDANRATGGLSDGAFYTANATYPSANYEVKVTYISGLASDDPVAIGARVADANNGYFLYVTSTSGQLYKRVSGTFSTIGASFAAPAVNDVLKLRVNGTTIEAYYNTTLMRTVTDSSLSAAAKAGVGMGQIGIGSGNDMSAQLLDNFQVNTINDPPTTALNTPADAATSISTTPTLNFTGTDPDGDTLEYNVLLSSFPRFDVLKTFWNFNENTGTTAADGTGLGNTLTWDTAQWDTGKIGSGVKIDSTHSLSAGIPTLPLGSNSRSVSFWAKFLSIGSNDTMWSWGTASANQAFGFQVNGTTTIRLSAWGPDMDWTVSTLNTGQWYHFVMTYNGSTTAELFIDGSSQGTKSTGSALNTVGSTFIVGRMPNFGAAPQNVVIDSLGIWNTVLSSTNITDLRNSGSGKEISTLSKVSTTDSGFTAGHPFASGVAKDFTVQSGDVLSTSTIYYWKVRSIDPSGTNTYGTWSGIRSFTTAASGGTPYTSTLSDTIGNSEAIIKAITRNRADTIINGEIIQKSTTRSLIDSIGNSELLSPYLSQFRTFTDSLGNLETIIKAGTRTLLDSINKTETIIKAGTRTLSDTIGNSDTLLIVRTYFQSLSDSLGNAETIIKATTRIFTDSIGKAETFIKAGSRIFVDLVGNAETFIKNNTRTFTDLSALADTIAWIKGQFRTLTDSLSNNETIIKAITKIRNETQSIADTISMLQARFKSFIDTIGNSEVFSTFKSKALNFSDTIGNTDTIIKAVTRILTEAALTLSETITKFQARFKSFADSVGISETMTKIKSSFTSFADSVGISETFQKMTSKIRSETLVLSEALQQAKARIYSDSLALTSVIVKATTKILLDSISKIETIGKAGTKILSESALLLSELFEYTTASIFEVSDNLGITDTISKIKARFISLSDSLGITDALLFVEDLLLNEIINLTSTISTFKENVRSFTDSISNSSIITFIKVKSFSDIINVTEIYEGFLNGISTVWKKIARTIGIWIKQPKAE